MTYLRNLFHRCDLDHNGVLDKEEAMRALAALGLPEKKLEPIFHLLDTNADGVISKREFKALALLQLQTERISLKPVEAQPVSRQARWITNPWKSLSDLDRRAPAPAVSR